MGKLDRYVLAQLLAVFGLASVVLTLAFWVREAARLFDWVISSGQNALVFLEFSALALPQLISLVLPFAAFAAALFVANRLTSDSELMIARASGQSPWRLARPFAIMGAFAAMLTAGLSHGIVPTAERQLADRLFQITENVTAQLLTPGEFIHPGENTAFYVRALDEDGTLRNLFLNDGRGDAETVTYTAARAQLSATPTGARLIMFDGMAQAMSEEDARLTVTRFDQLSLDISGLIEAAVRDGRDSEELDTWELLNPTTEIMLETGESRATLETRAHRRTTAAMAAFVMPVLGFAVLMVGGFSRFGIRYQIQAAVAVIVLLELFAGVMNGISAGRVGAWTFLYLAPLVGLALAAWFYWLAAHPGALRLRPRKAGA